MGPKLLVGDGPQRRSLGLLALEPLPPLLGGVAIQAWPADRHSPLAIVLLSIKIIKKEVLY